MPEVYINLNILIIGKYFVEESIGVTVGTKDYINILKPFYSKYISYCIFTHIHIFIIETFHFKLDFSDRLVFLFACLSGNSF